MGFKNGAYATCWEINPISEKVVKVRLSISRKDSKTEQYVQDFSGFCLFIGEAAAAIRSHSERARVRLVSCDVSNEYNKEQKREFVTYKVFEIDSVEGENNDKNEKKSAKKKKKAFDEDDVDDVPVGDEDTPF